MSGLTVEAWVLGGVLAVVIGYAMMARRVSLEKRYRAALLAERDEFAAYAQLDTTASGGDLKPMARQVCAAIAQHSPCRQTALLLRGEGGGLRVLGSAGVDHWLEAALTQWGARFEREQWFEPTAGPQRSYRVTLGPMENYDSPARHGTLRCRRVIMLPLRSGTGSGELVLGMLMVAPALGHRVDLERAMPPLEALADTLSRSLGLMIVEQRLMHAEEQLEWPQPHAVHSRFQSSQEPRASAGEPVSQRAAASFAATERDVPLMVAS